MDHTITQKLQDNYETNVLITFFEKNPLPRQQKLIGAE
jgi:hypothetical protein